MKPIEILEDELAKSMDALAEHRSAGRRGNIEAAVAALKIGWLKQILRRIDAGK